MDVPEKTRHRNGLALDFEWTAMSTSTTILHNTA